MVESKVLIAQHPQRVIVFGHPLLERRQFLAAAGHHENENDRRDAHHQADQEN